MKDVDEAAVPGVAIGVGVCFEEGGRPRSLRWEGVRGMSSYVVGLV